MDYMITFWCVVALHQSRCHCDFRTYVDVEKVDMHFFNPRGLAWHSAALKPRTCGPANLELCSDEVKKKIEGFMVPWMQFSMFTHEMWFCGFLSCSFGNLMSSSLVGSHCSVLHRFFRETLRPEVDMNRWAFASVCCSFAPSRQCLQIGLRARSAMPFELWKRRCEKIWMSICHIMLLWFERLILMLLGKVPIMKKVSAHMKKTKSEL